MSMEELIKHYTEGGADESKSKRAADLARELVSLGFQGIICPASEAIPLVLETLLMMQDSLSTSEKQLLGPFLFTLGSKLIYESHGAEALKESMVSVLELVQKIESKETRH